jgi:hypothetical protein
VWSVAVPPRSPIGPDAEPWLTRSGLRDVLAVIHNVTSATRLLDVLSLLHADPRLQFHFTWTESSVFVDGIAELLTELGAAELPWDAAINRSFDLAIAANYGGDLHRLQAPLLTVSHGMGYNKHFNRKAETGRPKPEGRNRKAETGKSRSGLLPGGSYTMGGSYRRRSCCPTRNSSTG